MARTGFVSVSPGDWAALAQDNGERRSSVKAALTPKRGPKRARRVVENDDFGVFIQRIIRAYGRRIAKGDIDALGALAALEDEVSVALDHAVAGLRECGYSWADIGSCLGVTRQAAQQRWGGDGG